MKNMYGLNEEDKALILEKWTNQVPEKLSVKNIEDEYVRANLAVLLENQDRARNGELVSEAVQANNSLTGIGGSNAQFSPITLAMVRRVFPELFANKIVGVQPMTGPVGLAYALRYKYDDNVADANEAGFQEVPKYSGFTGSTSGTSGSADAGTGSASGTAEAWQIGTDYPQIKLVIDQVAITAKSRKLGASFSLEAAQDLQAMHAIDIERELLKMLQYEIMAELDRELLQKCKTAATTVANGGEAAVSFDVSASDGRWSQEEYSNLVTMILKKANDIAVSTRIAAGNFVVASPRVVTAIQSAGRIFHNATHNVNGTQRVVEVGSINGVLTVYRDAYASSDYALVGYKGPGISDAGIIYSPYVTGLMSRAISPTDFAPRIGTMSRYALTDSLLGSGRYYRLINATNLDAVMGN